MKNQENQHLKAYELLIVFSLMVVTFISYGWLSSPIFTSEKISADQVKAEILAYQAAQIFLLKNVEKQVRQSRSLASENASFDGLIGEDSRGKPFRFSVIQEGEGQLRVLLSKESELPSEPPETIYDLKIEPAT